MVMLADKDIEGALAAFVGEIQQVPPMYSALKQGGVPLHRLARRGAEVERAPRPVTVHALELRAYASPRLEISVACSAGTYVRVLAADLGRRLGCLAHVAALRRTASGPFDLSVATTVETLDAASDAGTIAERLLPATDVLGLPILALGQEEARKVGHGGSLRAPGGSEGPLVGTRLAAVDHSGRLLAVLEVTPDRGLRPLRVLAAG